ncbi:MAG: hypothetical protein EBV19_08755 [Flavobacteriia bacterium]|nr:hypothetical protein [Flavobacteriia bacterium]
MVYKTCVAHSTSEYSMPPIVADSPYPPVNDNLNSIGVANSSLVQYSSSTDSESEKIGLTSTPSTTLQKVSGIPASRATASNHGFTDPHHMNITIRASGSNSVDVIVTSLETGDQTITSVNGSATSDTIDILYSYIDSDGNTMYTGIPTLVNAYNTEDGSRTSFLNASNPTNAGKIGLTTEFTSAQFGEGSSGQSYSLETFTIAYGKNLYLSLTKSYIQLIATTDNLALTADMYTITYQ